MGFHLSILLVDRFITYVPQVVEKNRVCDPCTADHLFRGHLFTMIVLEVYATFGDDLGLLNGFI